MTDHDQEFWRKKLMAFLHDAPDKCFDIANHEGSAARCQSAAGFTDNEIRKEREKEIKPADWFSASAERFVFPKQKCAHNFKDVPLFIHPLSSKNYVFPDGFASKSGSHSEAIQTAIGGIRTDDWHERFFLYWRRWQENATALANNQALAFLPADTRIPDHTIWNHMSVASALAPCVGGLDVRPELLLFQFGPVQEFIAQARSTRDLWSGSYLISWLVAHALKAVTDEIGPDTVIFPSLRGNGIFDALHKDLFYATPWKQGDQGGTQTTWERLIADKGGNAKVADWLLTPTLPNRFLAIVPPGAGERLARAAQQAIHSELKEIGEAVWTWLVRNGAHDEWKKRWDTQLEAFPQTAWAVQPWLDREACLAEAEKLPQDPDDTTGVAGRIKAMLELGENTLPKEDRDERYYSDKTTKTRLNNSGILWSAHYALLDAKLASRRNTRDFAQWDPVSKDAAVKDSLAGKEECIGDEMFWKKLTEEHEKIFTAASHRYGAMNLIKRLWCRPEATDYLPHKLGLDAAVVSKALRTDSTQDVARRNITASGVQSPSSSNPYIAVLSMDGDQMGKWVSGAKTPEFLAQLAPKAKEYLKGAAGLHRLLTPSYHLQFSEALANFAMHKARAVVEAHEGDLIYAGGDDVLAILPATRAIACARALRNAFRIDFEHGRMCPGSACEVSCGIAVGHQNAPLQMLVKEAQKAEKRAKNGYSRAALAISLYKRSGEIIEWGCKWRSGALDLMAEITRLTEADKLSGRFPYALAGLLQPYALEQAKPEELKAMQPVIQAEVRHVLSRQGTGLTDDERAELAREIDGWLAACWSPKAEDSAPRTQDSDDGIKKLHPQDFINLFLAETFINRSRGED
ncbi:MAG TPA: type III-B CRISPR-associated protein Cas10/Cmr2 [Kiritimatiellia bacterium]|nr:type III-B CRISPR-associated protein Cas10/Cmr2 [Kiritimatiellia bacterium]